MGGELVMSIGRVRAIVISAGGTATAKGFSSLRLPGSVVPNTISAMASAALRFILLA